MHIHNVYFWLKDEADASFADGLTLLTTDSNVKNSYYGRPAASAERDVVENNYTYGLVLVFDDLAGHDAYQVGAVHLQFVDGYEDMWTKVIVYDIEM